jgi:hypothetical protein
MRLISGFSALAAVAIWLTACATTTPVPGADKVRIAKNPSDVATCTAVGNIKVPGGAST